MTNDDIKKRLMEVEESRARAKLAIQYLHNSSISIKSGYTSKNIASERFPKTVYKQRIAYINTTIINNQSLWITCSYMSTHSLLELNTPDNNLVEIEISVFNSKPALMQWYKQMHMEVLCEENEINPIAITTSQNFIKVLKCADVE